ATQLSFRTYLEGDARHLRRERPQLIDHRVDGVLEFEDFALDVDGDLLGQVAVGDRRRNLGDVAHLPSQFTGRPVAVVAQVLPLSLHDALPILAAQLSFRAYLAGDARHLGRERVELIDHRVDGVL